MPANASTTTPANSSGMLKASADWLISRPSPAREPNSSATTTPIRPRPMPSLSPARMNGMAEGSDTLKKIWPRARAERAQHLDQPLAGGAQPRLGVDGDRKQHQEDHHQHLRPDADAEPENEQRRERDGGRGVEPGNPGLQRLLGGGAAGHAEAEHDADHAGDHVAERELDRADAMCRCISPLKVSA